MRGNRGARVNNSNVEISRDGSKVVNKQVNSRAVNKVNKVNRASVVNRDNRDNRVSVVNRDNRASKGSKGNKVSKGDRGNKDNKDNKVSRRVVNSKVDSSEAVNRRAGSRNRASSVGRATTAVNSVRNCASGCVMPKVCGARWAAPPVR